MRLVGYSAVRPAAGLYGVYVPLGPLTVLLGANDAGKTTLLRALRDDVDGSLAAEQEVPRDGGAFFAEVSDDELRRLLPLASSRSQPDWGIGAFRRELWTDLPNELDIAGYVQALRASASGPQSFDTVLERLAPSRLVCLEPRGLRGGTPEFAAFWCLPPMSELDPAVAAALRESELLRFRRERARA